VPKTKTPPRAGVTFRAVLQRLDRHLKKNDRRAIHAPRGRGDRVAREWFVVDLATDTLVGGRLTRIHVVEMARDLKLLKPWETVR
jgi:hypothetical protein